MPEGVVLPFFGKTNRNVDETELSDSSARLNDGYVDEENFTRRRPGLRLVRALPAGVNQRVEGLYWWSEKGYVIAVAGGIVYKVEYSAGSVSATSLSGQVVEANVPVEFADDGTYVFWCAGGRIAYTDGTNGAVYIADGDAPTSVSNIAWLDGYLLANDVGTNQFYWSNVNDSLTWTATDVASAAGDSDNIVALKVYGRDIYLFGEKSLEIWENDGVSPFARVPGGYRDYGCIAPHSVMRLGQNILWLDNERHIRGMAGGQSQIISSPYDNEIASFATVSDCRAFPMEFDGKQFAVFTFPSVSRTLVYNIQLQDWSEWNTWDSATYEYTRWLGNSHVNATEWGVHIVGSKQDADLFIMDAEEYEDDGEPIRLRRLTGHIDHGTARRKRSNEIRFRVKRGAVLLSAPPQLMIRWRDEGGDWSNEHHISLGAIGEREFVARIRRSGMYRARQYEITATAAAPILFGKAEEDFDVLRR